MCACGGKRRPTVVAPENIRASGSTTEQQNVSNDRRRNAGMTSASILAALRNANSR